VIILTFATNISYILTSQGFIVLFPQSHYKEKYENQVKGHYIGSYEDIFTVHCRKLEEMKNDVSFHIVDMHKFSSS